LSQKSIQNQEAKTLASRDRVIAELSEYYDDIERIEEEGISSQNDVAIVRKCLNLVMGDILTSRANSIVDDEG